MPPKTLECADAANGQQSTLCVCYLILRHNMTGTSQFFTWKFLRSQTMSARNVVSNLETLIYWTGWYLAFYWTQAFRAKTWHDKLIHYFLDICSGTFPIITAIGKHVLIFKWPFLHNNNTELYIYEMLKPRFKNTLIRISAASNFPDSPTIGFARIIDLIFCFTGRKTNIFNEASHSFFSTFFIPTLLTSDTQRPIPLSLRLSP